jgi:hypothetical protein
MNEPIQRQISQEGRDGFGVAVKYMETIRRLTGKQLGSGDGCGTKARGDFGKFAMPS